MVENIDFLNNPDLLKALSTKFKEPIISATSDLKFMQGGTVAQVYLVTGIAHNDMNVARDYKIVLKIQNYWERPNDTHSWRREYDLYTLNKDLHLTSKLHIPRCYLALIRKAVFKKSTDTGCLN